MHAVDHRLHGYPAVRRPALSHGQNAGLGIGRAARTTSGCRRRLGRRPPSRRFPRLRARQPRPRGPQIPTTHCAEAKAQILEDRASGTAAGSPSQASSRLVTGPECVCVQLMNTCASRNAATRSATCAADGPGRRRVQQTARSNAMSTAPHSRHRLEIQRRRPKRIVDSRGDPRDVRVAEQCRRAHWG